MERNVRRNRNRVLTAVVLLGLLLALPVTACTSGGEAPALESVLVFPRTGSLEIGETLQCIAIASYSDGSVSEVTGEASWASSDPAIASVTDEGLVTTLSDGSTVISATYEYQADSFTIQVGAPPKHLVAIQVLPADSSIEVGQTQQYSATASYSDGSSADVTASVTWETSNSLVVTITAAGLAEGKGAGAATITASFGDIEGSVSLQVMAPAAGAPNIPAWHAGFSFDQCASCHAPGANPSAPDWPAGHPPNPTCDIEGCHAWA